MRPISLIVAALLLLAPSSVPAQGPADPSGHWVGAVLVPNMEVPIEVDLAKDGNGLSGTFANPSQNLRGLPLGNISVVGKEVSFQVRGSAPGERAFKGTLSDDGQSLSGDYSQGGYTIPFVLARKGDPQGEAPARSAAVSKALEGTWNGALEASGVQRRLVLTVVNRPDGTSTGHFLNIDEGLEIPISAITEKASSVVLEVKALGGAYTGTLDAAGAELVGTWTQGPAGVPLTLRRAAK
jgi:hypothetical protein